MGTILVTLVGLVLAAPFFELYSSPVGGAISLFIIYIGLSQAWRLTGRRQILIMGPYQPSET
jgi:hypothetical protein